MATKVKVNGKYSQRAGVYSAVKSSIKNPVTQNSYSNILIIDDGIGAGWVGGSGINGQNTNGIDAVYSFDNLSAYQAFVKGGELWNIGNALFNPSGNQNGVSKVYFASARTTTPATLTHDLANGAFEITTKDEGANANGVINGTNLILGIAGKIIKTPSGKYCYQLWHGTYKGVDPENGVVYDGIDASLAKPQLLVQSPEVTTVAQLISWFQTNQDFNTGFSLNTGSTATGAITDADVTASYVLASGATEVYNAADLDSVLAKINNLDFVHILAMKFGANSTSANNDKIADWVQNQSKYDRILFVAGGFDKSERSLSKSTATHFNSDQVNVIHGGVKKTAARVANGFKVYTQLYHAALILGRGVGLPPQVPVTVKSIDVDGFIDPLEDDDQEDLISSGVMHSYYDTELGGVYVVGLDINSLQKNEFLINDDGTTYSWQLKRIEADLNKFMTLSGKARFFDPEGLGGNRNTTSPEEVTVWAQNQLKSRQAGDKKDDLIISYKDVVATISQDNISLDYKFVPNTEVKAVLATGTMIEG